MSTEQRENLDAVLRQSAFPVGSDVNEQRRQLRELISAQPLPADVTVTATAMPPLIIQAGTREVLLDDAFRLARQAATADVEVTLDVIPRVLSAHLAGAELVTA